MTRRILGAALILLPPSAMTALAVLDAQTGPNGVVDVATSITATAGTLQCVAAEIAGQAVSVLHVRCVDAGAPLHESDYNVPTDGAAAYSLTRGSNTVSWTLTHGAPDQWRIAANDVVRTGSF